ncbi:poly(A) binding protein Pab2 [Ranunculus cassubicifolius]
MLGEFLYTLVDQLEHHMAAKVTRMLMKLDPLIVMLLISSPEALKAKVAEAMELLRNNDDAMFVVSKFEYEKFTS